MKRDHGHRAAWLARRAMAGTLPVAALLAGCSGSGSSGGHAVSVRPADFASADGQPQAHPAVMSSSDPTPPAKVSAAAPGKFDRTGPIAASEGIFDVFAEIGPPSMAASDAGPVEDPRFVQAKVGDINGRAVYAADFLFPIEARLKAEAKKKKRDEWMQFAGRLIASRLQGIIQDELIMAEARESFTPEQRKGFFAFVENMRANLYSENGGSRAAANKKLFEDQGMDETEWLRDQESRQLIQFQYMQMISRKTVVSWREIQQLYYRDYDKYHPAPKAVFHVITVTTSKADHVAAITDALAAGEDFDAIAARPENEYKRATAGLQEVTFDGDQASAEFFGPKELNEPARSLPPGKWVGPITWGEKLAWIYLERIEQRLPSSLYAEQLNLEHDIREQKKKEALMKYLDRVRARTTITDEGEMTRRLLEIAAERYYPATGGPSPAPATTPPNSGAKK